jgi:hypothetical protein
VNYDVNGQNQYPPGTEYLGNIENFPVGIKQERHESRFRSLETAAALARVTGLWNLWKDYRKKQHAAAMPLPHIIQEFNTWMWLNQGKHTSLTFPADVTGAPGAFAEGTATILDGANAGQTTSVRFAFGHDGSSEWRIPERAVIEQEQQPGRLRRASP